MEDGLLSEVLEQNALADTVDAFVASGDPCWFVDRHVLGPSIEKPGAELVSATCAAAVELARRWLKEVQAFRSAGLFISQPFVTIDDEWLDRVANSPPPHVYVVLARNVSTEGAGSPVQD